MTADELIELARNPRFIEGIHNYCDRWCERCAFTEHCFHFAQLRAMEDEAGFDPTDPDQENKHLLHTLQSSFELTAELIERGAAKHGIDLSREVPADDDDEDEFDGARRHPLMQLAEDYACGVDAWLERVERQLEERIRRAQQSDDIRAEQLQPEDVLDALEIIRWDQFRIAPTMAGVFSTLRLREHLAEHHNGKIKSVLIGIDRSLLAWGKVEMFWPAQAKEFMQFVGNLDELRAWLEALFPEARDFIRPGFDEASPHVM